jgi:hypothetical protein
MPQRRCPYDTTIIPRVAEIPHPVGLVRCFWCGSCGVLVAFIGDSKKPTAGFAAEETTSWRLWEAFGSEAEVSAVTEAVSLVREGEWEEQWDS